MRNLLLHNEGSWNTPEIVTAIQDYFVTLRDAGCFPDDPSAINYNDGNDLFFTGQALLHTTGSWEITDIEEQMPDQEVGFVPFPELPGGKGRVWISGVGSAWYITSTAKNPDAAASFIDYLFSQPAVEKWIGVSRYFVPVQVDLANVQIGPLSKQVIDTLQSAGTDETQFGYNVDVLAPPSFNDAMQNGFQAILAGDKTPEQEAADLQAAWEEGMGAAAATPTG